MSDSRENEWAGMYDLVTTRFGGYVRTAELTGIPAKTVYSWRRSGLVPEKYRLTLLRAAQEHKINLKPVDFVRHLQAALAAV